MTLVNEGALWRMGSEVRRWEIFKRVREKMRDLETVRANELDFFFFFFAGDLAFCSWYSLYLSPL